jgi:hypothetical protein
VLELQKRLAYHIEDHHSDERYLNIEYRAMGDYNIEYRAMGDYNNLHASDSDLFIWYLNFKSKIQYCRATQKSKGTLPPSGQASHQPFVAGTLNLMTRGLFKPLEIWDRVHTTCHQEKGGLQRLFPLKPQGEEETTLPPPERLAQADYRLYPGFSVVVLGVSILLSTGGAAVIA